MARTRTVDLGMELDGVDLTITATYYAGSSDYWDRAYGCFMPGDPSDVEIVEIAETETGVLRPDLLAAVEAKIDDVLDRAADQAQQDEDDDGDRRYEEARDRAMEREV